MSDNFVMRYRPSHVPSSSRRQRWYPRTLDVLRRLHRPGARLVWGEIDGKYRIDGGKRRRDGVQPRTLNKLLRRAVVQRAHGTADLVITERGRRIAERYKHVAIDTFDRRILRVAIEELIRTQTVKATVWDGTNFRDLHQVVGAGFQTRYNPDTDSIEAVIPADDAPVVLEPQTHRVVVIDGAVQVMTVKEYAEFRQSGGWKVSRPQAA